MSWLNKGRRRRSRARALADSCTHPMKPTSNRLILDLRSGIRSALSRLSLVSAEVDHLVLRQSAVPSATGSGVTDEDLCNIFHAIASLPRLKTIVISDFERPALSVGFLVLLLHHSLALSALRLDAIHLSGSETDFARLAVALRGHPALEQICLSGCSIFREATMESYDPNENENVDFMRSMFTSVAKAISKISTLTMVEIVETSCSSNGAWTGESLSQLCKSASMRVLRVRGVRFLGDRDITLVAEALHSNTAMKELWLLSCELGLSGHGPEAVARMLTVNSSLEVLGLNRLSYNEHALVISEALKYNCSLRGLHLCIREGLTRQIFDSFTKLMKHNYVLEKMSGGFIGTAGDTEIDFYLRLNQNGRGSLLQNDKSTREDWIKALCLQSDDVSALFYLLSRNPTLCWQR